MTPTAAGRALSSVPEDNSGEPDKRPTFGVMTPAEWLSWVLDQYGLTPAQVSRRGSMSPAALASISLIGAVLSPRLSAAIVGEMLGVSRDRVHNAVKRRTLDNHGITADVLTYHRALLVPEPHRLTGR